MARHSQFSHEKIIERSSQPFFFSSRRRHTRSKRDWSSDVCSSDLDMTSVRSHVRATGFLLLHYRKRLARQNRRRSEERRVGKECRARWSEDQEKKKRHRKKNLVKLNSEYRPLLRRRNNQYADKFLK